MRWELNMSENLSENLRRKLSKASYVPFKNIEGNIIWVNLAHVGAIYQSNAIPVNYTCLEANSRIVRIDAPIEEVLAAIAEHQ